MPPSATTSATPSATTSESLPNPKFDEAQETYCNENDPYGTGFFSLPITCADPERSGIIIEAFSARSMQVVLPAYYDIGRYYNWGSMYGTISSMWNNKQDTFASSFEKTSKVVNKSMEKTLKAYGTEG